jgi:hypothetical protein
MIGLLRNHIKRYGNANETTTLMKVSDLVDISEQDNVVACTVPYMVT